MKNTFNQEFYAPHITSDKTDRILHVCGLWLYFLLGKALRSSSLSLSFEIRVAARRMPFQIKRIDIKTQAR